MKNHYANSRGTLNRALVVLTLSFLCVSTTFAFSGGDGSPENPYQVATAAHLDAVRNHLDAHFVQTADIDLGVAPWSELEGWEPIGDTTDPFTGVYDGGGQQVQGLTIDRQTQPVGLFGVTEGAVVRNVQLVNLSVAGDSQVGGLIGWAKDSTVDLVRVTGQVTGTSSNVGGLIGQMDAGGMQRTEVDVTVNGAQNTGGIVGFAQDSAQLRYVSARGSVAGTDRVGGVAGYFQEGTIADAFSLAAVAGVNEVGGLVGLTGYYSHAAVIIHYRGVLSKCFSAGSVTGTGSFVGGFTGRNWNAPVHYDQSVLSCYNAWDVDASGMTMSGEDNAVPLTTVEMQQAESFPALDLDRVWAIDEGVGYPFLRDLSGYSAEVPEAAALENLPGAGTMEDPHLISTVAQLLAVGEGLDRHYRLTNNLDLSDSMVWNHGQGLLPIGDGSNPFTGSFDGAGYELVGLRSNRPTLRDLGMFARLEEAHIYHVKISNGAVAGFAEVGLLAGSSKNSLTEGVEVEGRVNGIYNTGGIVGEMAGGILRRASADIALVGDEWIGGLVGYVEVVSSSEPKALLERVSSSGQVHGSLRVGGLVGYLMHGEILDAYSRADVFGVDYVGGLVGRSGYFSSSPSEVRKAGDIYRSYSTGEVVSDGTRVGGVLGYETLKILYGSWIYEISTFSACCWDTETSGLATTAGAETDGVVGIFPRTTEQMKDILFFEGMGWDFDGVWAINPNANDGYPFLIDTIEHALVYTASEGGSIDGDANQAVSHGGAGDLVTAVPEIGWEFVQWNDGVTTAQRQAINVTAPVSVVAEFAPIQYTLSYTAGQGGTIGGPAEQNVLYGGNGQAVTALPAAGWEFTQWSDGVTTAERQAINVTAPVSVVAEFTAIQYTLSYTAGQGGTIGGPAAQDVLYGANGQAVTALPTTGWEFVQWSDGVTTAQRQAINVTASLSVVAEFAPIRYTLSYTAGQGGTIGGPAEQSVLYGEDGQSVTAVPLTDWRFVQWSDGVTTAPRQDLNVTSPLSVVAEFAPIQELLDFAVIDSNPSGVRITSSANYLVRDSLGSIHVSYGMNSHIYSSRSDDNGTSWSARLRAETYPNSTSPNTLAIDGEDVLHLGFTFNVGSFYTRSVDRGGSWQSPVALHDGGWGDWDYVPQIAVASNGDLSVVYYTLYGWGYGGNLPFNLVFKESDNSGATWTPREDLTSYAIDSGPYGAREQNYCLGSDGWRFVGYTFNEDPARDSGIPVRRLIYYDGTDWTEVQVSTTGHAVRAGGDMAVDSQGQLHLTWVESSIAGEADQLMYRRFDPATRQMTAIRRISLRSENPKNVSLGVYADDTVAIAYDLHRIELEEVVYEGVYLRASDDDFRSPRRVSTHPNANTPNLRSHTEFMHQSDKWDMLWIEPTADASSGQLVYADVSPLAPVGGFIVELLAAPSEGGDVTGGGFVPSGTSVLVEAQPKEGWSFVAWMEDGVEVSTEPSYEWTPQADALLTANFLDRSGESYTLHYVEGAGGSVTGDALQTVGYSGSGSEVFAEAAAGAAFHQWSDGSTANPRIDQNVQADLTVTAQFQTAGGVDIDWYAAHEIAPGAGQTWTDLDDMDWLGKGMTLADEFVAGTDPNDLQSYFAATPPAVEGTGFSVHFQPSLPERRYTLFRSTDLSEWLPVPGMQNVPGGNGPMVDSDPPESSAFYRIEATLP